MCLILFLLELLIAQSNNLAMLDDLNPKLLIICKFFNSICLLMFLESHFCRCHSKGELYDQKNKIDRDLKK